MATAKSARKQITSPVTVPPAINPGTGLVTVNIFDGTRQPLKSGTQVLLTVRDGAQNQVYKDEFAAPSITLRLTIHDNFMDNYSIVASADGYQQAGFYPVKINSSIPQTVDLMLLAKNSDFHFAQARWTDVQSQKPALASLIQGSVGAGDPALAYTSLLENKPRNLACLLNITTALQQISLPQRSPLDYFKALDLAALAPDRIFGYADPALVAQVKQAAFQGEFVQEPAFDLALHGDATSSFKQIQYGEANVQLTFHEKKTKTINGIECIYVEPDIDYYKDTGAHFFLEVIPNGLTGSVSDPKAVYVLRWIAGRRAGVPNFDPLFTVE